MTTYGYVRVSTEGQNVARQLEKMIALGIDEQHVYIDHASGKDLERDSYKELMAQVREGDLIVFDSLDRLGRDYADVTAEWRRLCAAGIDLRVLDLEFFDSAHLREMGSLGVCVEDMLLSLLAYVAQTEREKNRQRQAEGIAIAKAQGRYKGRKRLEYDSDASADASCALRERGVSAAARALGVSRSTVRRMVEDGRLVA